MHRLLIDIRLKCVIRIVKRRQSIGIVHMRRLIEREFVHKSGTPLPSSSVRPNVLPQNSVELRCHVDPFRPNEGSYLSTVCFLLNPRTWENSVFRESEHEREVLARHE